MDNNVKATFDIMQTFKEKVEERFAKCSDKDKLVSNHQLAVMELMILYDYGSITEREKITLFNWLNKRFVERNRDQLNDRGIKI